MYGIRRGQFLQKYITNTYRLLTLLIRKILQRLMFTGKYAFHGITSHSHPEVTILRKQWFIGVTDKISARFAKTTSILPADSHHSVQRPSQFTMYFMVRNFPLPYERRCYLDALNHNSSPWADSMSERHTHIYKKFKSHSLSLAPHSSSSARLLWARSAPLLSSWNSFSTTVPDKKWFSLKYPYY